MCVCGGGGGGAREIGGMLVLGRAPGVQFSFVGSKTAMASFRNKVCGR